MNSEPKSPGAEQSSIVPMMIIGGLFFIFGFVTWLNGSLIPFLEIVCELNHIEAYLVTMVFYIAYTITALPVSMVLKRVDYKNGMMIGLLVMAVGSLLFIPAAEARLFGIFLIALFVLGIGLTILQTASNPYIVHIGPHETAAVRISIMGLLNKGAGVVAPLVFTAYILTDISQYNAARLSTLEEAQHAIELAELSSRLIGPYLIMSGILFLLSIVIKFAPLPKLALGGKEEGQKHKTRIRDILQYPQLILGTIALFFYVGVEVIAGDTIGLFGKEKGVEHFGQLTSYTMAFMLAGYSLGLVVIPRWLKQETALMLSAILGVTLTLLIISTGAQSSSVWELLFSWTGVPAIPNTVLYIAMLGLANALVWPAVWPLALKGLGQHTSTGSALLIMGISGGAVFPFLYGVLSEISGNSQTAYWIMLPSYLFILLYATKGHRMTSWK